jgi:DNA-binding GntR family transcriptional regulator
MAGNSVEQAASYLRRLIFTGVLEADAKVPQAEVAAALGMTRIPVREALLILELEGRVRTVPNRGAYVAAVTERSAHNAIDLLTVVHSFAIRRAIESSTPELLAELRAAADHVQATTEPVELYYAYDAFQDVIVHNGLDGRVGAFIRRLRRLSPDTLYEHDPAIPKIVKKATKQILRAIERSDQVEAERVLRDAHEMILKRMIPLMRNDGLMKG